MQEAALELGYQPTDNFCLKVSQLREILSVRWSVFLLGPAGSGKTAIWRTLMRAQQLLGEKAIYKPINPKVAAASVHTCMLPCKGNSEADGPHPPPSHRIDTQCLKQVGLHRCLISIPTHMSASCHTMLRKLIFSMRVCAC